MRTYIRSLYDDRRKRGVEGGELTKAPAFNGLFGLVWLGFRVGALSQRVTCASSRVYVHVPVARPWMRGLVAGYARERTGGERREEGGY